MTHGTAPVRVSSNSKKGKTSQKSSSKPSASGSSRSSKTKNKDNAKSVAAVLVIILLLAVAGGGLYLKSTGFFDPKYDVVLADGTSDKLSAKEIRSRLTTDNFIDGIIINGVNVSGMSKDQALEALRPNQPPMPTLNISLNLDGVNYPLDLSSLTLTSTLDSVVDEAYNYLRLTGEEDAQTLVNVFNQRQALVNNPAQYSSAYTLSSEGVEQIVNETLADSTSVAQDAVITGFNPETGSFSYTESQRGYEIDMDEAVTNVRNLLESGTYEGVVDVVASVTEPSLTTEMIENEFGLIASSTSTTTSNSNRNHNISITCEKINGLVLQPGETWSFNDFIGERTAASGYEVAGVIENGQSAQAYGGGICQVSSMIYQSVIKSDLEVIERNPHMWPSTYAAPGTDAAVDWPNQDFQFRNSSDYPIALSAYWDPSTSKVTVAIYGHQFPDGQHIEFEGETLSTNPAGVQYIANPALPVGQTNSLRAAHDGVTAASYQIWLDSDGNEIRRVELSNSWYSTISAQIEVGTLNPDGTQAELDPGTGALTNVVEGDPTAETGDPNADPNAVPDPNADPNADPNVNPEQPAPQPAETQPAEQPAEQPPAEQPAA